ncbi:MAG: thioredoxin family protein [Pirellulaceae bacterium]|nr:thioredoxin family protein [Pirellulaceae bacterium]
MKRTTDFAESLRSIPALFCLVAWLSLVLASGCSSSVTTGPPQPIDEATDAGEMNETAAADATDVTGHEGTAGAAASEPAIATGLPRMVDLGAKKCIPCKMMAPILEDLMENYADTLQTEFIDVWENPQEAQKYGIETIPTQIFFDAAGKEQFRHVGFISKEDILATWKKLGVEVKE